MVFYRKYRPQKIEELDNEAVRENLLATFGNYVPDYSLRLQGKHKPSPHLSVPHAFLFTGPKGLGKTSTARIVAKVINCTAKKTSIEPCNKCDQCVSITNGNNLDVFEIDGASNRGIDEIRDLREKIKLAPFKAAKKVYIIDEVHMLTTEAFNALLKTLEEPPNHAVFILCTTEPHKVPVTIASRCFRVNFSVATNEELIRSMGRIVKSEGIKTDKDALSEIARLSDGSFREAAKILEEVSIIAGKKTITKELVNEKYNITGIGESVSLLIESFMQKDVKKGLGICKDLAKQGMDFKFLIEELIERLHLMLLMEAGVEPKDNFARPTLFQIKQLFELLTKAYQETKYSVLPQVPLELAILEWARNNDDALRSASSLDESSNASTPAKLGAHAAMRGLAKTSSSKTPPRASNNLLNDLIEEVKKHNPLLAGVLRSCGIKDIKNGKLNIVTNSKFHQEKLEDIKAMKLLKESVDKITGKDIKIQIV